MLRLLGRIRDRTRTILRKEVCGALCCHSFELRLFGGRNFALPFVPTFVVGCVKLFVVSSLRACAERRKVRDVLVLPKGLGDRRQGVDGIGGTLSGRVLELRAF